MGFAQSGETVCPVGQTLAMVGERWTLLIVRELFMGTKRFDEFQMYTEMSPHLLSMRLKDLETEGIVKRKQYQDRPPRFEYKLTPKGMDLFPLIVSLKLFGDKWGKYKSRGRAALTMMHSKCEHSTELRMLCTTCGELYGPRDTTTILSDSFAAERAERKEAYLAKQRPRAKN